MFQRSVVRFLLFWCFIPAVVVFLLLAIFDRGPDQGPREVWEDFAEVMGDYWACFKRGYL